MGVFENYLRAGEPANNRSQSYRKTGKYREKHNAEFFHMISIIIVEFSFQQLR